MRSLTCLAGLLAALALTACNDPVSAKDAEDPVAAMEGGTPMPAVACKVQFPWMGKQSVMCVGDSFERQIAFVDFAHEGVDAIGSAALEADGSGTATFTVPAKSLLTGHADRDEKLLGGAWLDAETHPNLVLDITSMKKLKPTVWRAKGTWEVRGSAKPVEFLVNVRYIEEMKYVGKDVVRVTGSFDFDMKEHGILNDSVGTPAVAGTWTVDVGLLGVMVREPK